MVLAVCPFVGTGPCAAAAAVENRVTNSAPTELAASIAKATDLTLIALARGRFRNVFDDTFPVFSKSL